MAPEKQALRAPKVKSQEAEKSEGKEAPPQDASFTPACKMRTSHQKSRSRHFLMTKLSLPPEKQQTVTKNGAGQDSDSKGRSIESPNTTMWQSQAGDGEGGGKRELGNRKRKAVNPKGRGRRLVVYPEVMGNRRMPTEEGGQRTTESSM